MGIAPDGAPNLVEQGEVKFNDYIFSNRLFATKIYYLLIIFLQVTPIIHLQILLREWAKSLQKDQMIL